LREAHFINTEFHKRTQRKKDRRATSFFLFPFSLL
jgi:hypothetical protein